MRERASSSITIYKLDGSAIASVIIEPTSIRKFDLMGDDYVRIDFSVSSPFNIPIGSYVIDEFFGKFVCTEDQLPTYSNETDSYRYEMRFDALYKVWANYVHMMTVEVDGQLVRKEADWSLTQSLSVHANEIVKELGVIGFEGYSVVVSDTAEKAIEAHTLKYTNTSILDAIDSIAKEFETEWFVDVVGKTIFFGKVEEGDEIEMSINGNVEQMDIQRDRDNYANKIYVYGGNVNLPYSYRRKLLLTIQTATYKRYMLYTGDKKLTPDMAPKQLNATFVMPDSMPGSTTQTKVVSSKVSIYSPGAYNIMYDKFEFEWPYVVFYRTTSAGTPSISATLTISVNGRTIATFRHTYTKLSDGVANMFEPVVETLNGAIDEIVFSTGEQTAIIELSVSVDSYTRLNGVGACRLGIGSIRAERSSNGMSDVVPCIANGVTNCFIVFNPLEVRKIDETTFKENADWFAFTFCDANGNPTSAPAGAGPGMVLEVKDDGFPNIPTSFYTIPYDDPSSLYSVGANRLKMPDVDYVTTEDFNEAGAIENVVLFEDIYPEAKLKVTNIVETQRKDHTEYEGEREKTDWTWTEYSLELSFLNGQSFPFKLDYMLPGTLRLKFLSPMDAGVSVPGDGYKLTGMTYDVAFNKNKNLYTIVRNTNYGATLPNEVLRPKVGDACILEGWNVKAIKNLGIIADAEQRLQAKAEEYVDALNQAQFVFNCTMYSDFILNRDSFVWIGQKVSVSHGALKRPVSSRVIGVEYKLDKPYDSPVIKIGETEAYSRLAKIEKEITSIK